MSPLELSINYIVERRFMIRTMKTKHNILNGENQHQPVKRHPLGWSLPALFLVLALAGCKPEAKVTADKVAADINPAGVYTLASVDGKPVPCALTHEGVAMTVQSGVFTINADGTCSSKVNFSVPSHGDAIREVKATYTRQGAELTMVWEGAGTTIGSVEGNKFTMNNEGMVFAYHK
jgi:hypothetical protein